MPLPGSNRDKQMQAQFLQEIVEPKVQAEQTEVEEIADEAPTKKSKKTKGRKKVLGLF